MPKRKAATRISGLVDSDSDDVAETVASAHEEQPQQPPIKRARGRPKSTVSSNKAVGPSSTATTTASTRRPLSSSGGGTAAKKPAARGRPRSTVSEQDDEQSDALSDDAAQAQVYAVKKDTSTRAQKGRPGRKPGGTAKQVTEDGEFDYTPTRPRQSKPAASMIKQPGGRKSLEADDGSVVSDSQAPRAHDATSDEEEEAETNTTTTSPRKALSSDHQSSQPRKRPNVTFADAQKTPSDPELRRKLGDMTKKYETLESKYRTLREIGIVEANANLEKIKKQCESVTNSSNKLIASLKEELAAQTARSKESRDLQKQLRERETESSSLQAQVDDLTAELTTAQTEIKTLQTKLAAARNNATSAKTLHVEAPGSAVKSMANRNAAVSASAEAMQAAQLAQLKEDLYGDLTGLIIRSVKQRETDHLYDCIQTGVNGTLQFKLAVAHEGGSKTTASLDTAEFQYMPLLDAKRDAALINILPEYLTVDITFSRQNASKFYTKVMDSLTKRRIDPEN